MSRKGLGVFCVFVIGVIMIFVIGGVPRSKGKTGSQSRIQTVGLPEHGVMIVGPTDVTFTTLMAKQKQQTSGGNIDESKASSVFVVNESGKTISALSVKWELLQADGRIIAHTRGHRSTLKVVSNAGLAGLEPDITPGDQQWVSLLSNSSGASKGFRVNTGGGGADKARQLSESVRVTISIDAVLFDDGTFVGRDTRNLFESLKAELEARREVFAEIVRALNGDSNAMKHIERLAKADHNGMQSLSRQVDESTENQAVQREYASITLAMRKELGDKVILERLNTELSKPQINLRKP